jgi:hypothetical protein
MAYKKNQKDLFRVQSNKMPNVETVSVNLTMNTAKSFIRNEAAMSFRFELRGGNWYVQVGGNEKFVKSTDTNWRTEDKINDVMGLIFSFGLDEPISEAEGVWGFIFKETEAWDHGSIKIIKDWCNFAKVIMGYSSFDQDNIIEEAERVVLLSKNTEDLEKKKRLKKSI